VQELAELIQKYKSEGTAIFASEFSKLFQEACSQNSSKSFKYFVVDVGLDLQHWKNAIDILDAIQKTYGLDDIGYNLLAFARWELNDETGAIDAYRKSLVLNSANISSLRGVCILLNDHDRELEALRFVQKWLQLAPSNAEAIEYNEIIVKNCNSALFLTSPDSR
jgi:hypothetical protein